MLYEATLENLINRSLLVQEAKHHMGKKDAKLLDLFNEAADQAFRQSEIIPLQRQYQVDTEYQLKEKLALQGPLDHPDATRLPPDVSRRPVICTRSSATRSRSICQICSNTMMSTSRSKSLTGRP